MHSDDTESLLDDLRSGRIAVSDLSGEQFQRLIFCKLLNLCRRSSSYEYDVIDNYHGAVDFVVRERPLFASPFLAECATHVFECKHYRRTLELSTVAKLLVFGVRFQPASLNIVSCTNLQPQVYDYARVLFSGLGNQSAMFKGTLFRHYRTSELLDLELGPEYNQQNKAELHLTDGENVELFWEISECQPFSERIVADSQGCKSFLVLRNSFYRLTISVYTLHPPDQYKLWLDDLPSGVIVSECPAVIAILGDKKTHLKQVYMLDFSRLTGPATSSIAIHLSYKSQRHRVLTASFSLSSHSPRSSLVNLRRAETEDFAEKLTQREAVRLLLLGGMAGVGKTFFCEAIATKLRWTTNFIVNRFSVDSNSGHNLLWMMLVTICTPAQSLLGGEESWLALASTIVKALSPIEENISQDYTSGQANAQVIVPVLAEFLIRSGPRLLIFPDAHLLSESEARGLYALIIRLDDLGWGDIYCVIEHRTPFLNNAWNTLESKLRSRVNASSSRQLEPLTAKQLDEFLRSFFVHIDAELKEIIWTKCGGVPLYLDSLLDLLKKQGAIRRGEAGRWDITTPSEFEKSSLTYRRADGVLEERLRSISWEVPELPDGISGSPLSLVAMIAIANDDARVRCLVQLLTMKPSVLQSIRRILIVNGVIRDAGNNLRFDFQHDLLRQAAIRIGREQECPLAFVERAIGRAQRSDCSALELELVGDIASWAGLRVDSINALNAAFERLARSDDFIVLGRILKKLCTGLEPNSLSSPKNYASYFSARSALAWVTWNSGSQVEARNQYSNLVEDVLNEDYPGRDLVTTEAWAADAQRRILGIDLELQDVPQFLGSAKSALALHGDSIAFHSIVNRLILYCAEFCHIPFGLYLSRLTLRIFGDSKPESSGAVICSDIGRLFRMALPDEALVLYRKGVELACERRQRLHNTMDVLATELLLGRRELTQEEIQSWRTQLTESGLRRMLLRFDLFCASMAIRSGRAGHARRVFRHLETTITIYRYENCWLPMWNDGLIASLLDGDRDEAENLASLILERLERLLVERQRAMEKLFELRSAIEVHKARFLHLGPLNINMPREAPAYSGTILQIVLNMLSLSKVMDGRLGKKLMGAADLWPADVDLTKAMAAFSLQPKEGLIEYKGQIFATCLQ